MSCKGLTQSLNISVLFQLVITSKVSNSLDPDKAPSRLAIDRSICILTRPVVNTGLNRSLLVDWWSIGRLKEHGQCDDTKHKLSILLDSINRLKIVSI